MDGVAGVADDQRRRLEGAAIASLGRGAPKDDPLQDRRAGAGILRDRIERELQQQRQPLPVDATGDARECRHHGFSECKREQQRREDGRAGGDRVVEDWHLDEHAPQSRRGRRGHLERDVRPQRGASDDRLIELQVVQQRHRLRREGRHRVAPHVPRAV